MQPVHGRSAAAGPRGDDEKEDDGKNPWFNEEIAAIVKLHRKTIRKYHRSKTKKVELKQMCKELEKRKRKLIKAAKQRHSQQATAMAGNGGNGGNGGNAVEAMGSAMGNAVGANAEAHYAVQRVPGNGHGHGRGQMAMSSNVGHQSPSLSVGQHSAHSQSAGSQREQSVPSTAMLQRHSGSTEDEKREDPNAFPKTHIENVREIDASLIPNVDIPQFFKTASKQIYQICDTYL